VREGKDPTHSIHMKLTNNNDDHDEISKYMNYIIMINRHNYGHHPNIHPITNCYDLFLSDSKQHLYDYGTPPPLLNPHTTTTTVMINMYGGIN